MTEEEFSVAGSALADRCSVIDCMNRPSNSVNVSFHRIPANSVTQKLWMQTLKLDPKASVENARICSDHFDPLCFKRRGGTVELLEGSIPAMKLKRKVRPNRKYTEEEVPVPSKRQRTTIKVERCSPEPEAISPEKRNQTVEPDQVSDGDVENVSLSRPAKVRKSSKSEERYIVSESHEGVAVKEENDVTSNAVSKARTTVRSVKKNIGSTTVRKATVMSVKKNVSSAYARKATPRKVMATDEEVARWEKEFLPTVVPPASYLPVAQPPTNGKPRRFVTKLSQCVNEDDDDEHYIISKINFAMAFIQSQDRKIKEINDKYVELTRENEQLREEQNVLRAQLESARLSGQMKTATPAAQGIPVTVLRAQSVSKTVTPAQAGTPAQTVIKTVGGVVAGSNAVTPAQAVAPLHAVSVAKTVLPVAVARADLSEFVISTPNTTVLTQKGVLKSPVLASNSLSPNVSELTNIAVGAKQADNTSSAGAVGIAVGAKKADNTSSANVASVLNNTSITRASNMIVVRKKDAN